MDGGVVVVGLGTYKKIGENQLWIKKVNVDLFSYRGV